MKIALIGYGKMGHEIEAVAKAAGHEISLCIALENKEEFTIENLRMCDVAIEFTAPQSAFDNIKKCFEAGIPVVCGSTGWYDKLETVKQLCLEQNQSFLFASNFSIGVNVFFEMNKMLASLMNKYPDYDVSVEEIHHIQKLDKPSGTGLTLANDVLKFNNRKHGIKLEDATEIGANDLVIHSIREPDVVGTHTVKYQSAIDEITITHKAYSRKGFAVGAVAAAEWLVNNKGFYEMRDMLGLKFGQ
jgi:4-hydroxy-tetrahydrodipicolinate reductase